MIDRRSLILAGGAAALLSVPALADPNKGFVDVRHFGAKGNGATVDTPAINKAIDHVAERGGGTVLFPAGTYASYTIRLKSNVTLWLDNGAVILAARPEEGKPGYDAAEPIDPSYEAFQDYGHGHWRNSLIWGEGLHDVAILGSGMIWGKGARPRRRQGQLAEGPQWPRHRQQGDRAQELPQRGAARLQDPRRRLVRDAADRGRQPHDRQPRDRHQPRRHGHRLLQERPRLELHGQFAVGRRHLPQEQLRARLPARHRERHHRQLPRHRQLSGRIGDRRDVAQDARRFRQGYPRPHQVRHRDQRRLPQHRDQQLRVRGEPRAGVRDRRPAG